MDATAKGLLQAMSLSERMRVENEFEGLFCELTDALEDMRHGLYDLERLLDQTFQG